MVYISASSLLFFSAFSFARAENRSENVRNGVSATANTGGNTITGDGTIKTGDAKATVNARSYVNGGENVQNKVEAKAEVQGDGATASVEVNGEKKSCTAENGEGCEVEIKSENNSASATVDETADVAEKVEKEKNIIQNVVGTISGLTKDIIDGIREWLS